MTATNKTLQSPPSSAPRDLTVQPHSSAKELEDSNIVTLSWQTPKYANGDIEGNLKKVRK